MAKVSDYLNKRSAEFRYALMNIDVATKNKEAYFYNYNSARDFAEAIVSVPFDKLKDFLEYDGKKGDYVIGKLIDRLGAFFDAYYNGKEIKKDETSNAVLAVMEYSKKIADEKAEKNAEKNADKNEKTDVDKYNELRKTYFGINAEYESDRGIMYDYEDDFLKDCAKDLSKEDRMFRGSSDEYKDIQKEINQLIEDNEIIDDMQFKNEEKYLAGKMYMAKMMKVIAEKADRYVSVRHKSELENSVDSYKGRRIAAMRVLSNRLMKKSDMMQVEIEKAYAGKDASKIKNKCMNMLKKKCATTSFTKRMYAEIESLRTGADVEGIMNEPSLVAMGKCLNRSKLTFDKMTMIHDKVNANHYDYVSSLGNENDMKKLKADKGKLTKLKHLYHDDMNLSALDNPIYEESPDFFTKDYLTNVVLIHDRLACVNERLTEIKNQPEKEIQQGVGLNF